MKLVLRTWRTHWQHRSRTGVEKSGVCFRWFTCDLAPKTGYAPSYIFYDDDADDDYDDDADDVDDDDDDDDENTQLILNSFLRGYALWITFWFLRIV